MTQLQGMVVRLQVENRAWAGTDDHLYIGIIGKGGGREFPLDVARFNDFERGTDVTYWLGTVFDGSAVTGAVRPRDSRPGQRNSPDWHTVQLDDVDYVYIRKAGSKSRAGDDAFEFDSVRVALYGTDPQVRVFRQTSDLWLANEYGQISYLPEQDD